MKILTDEEVKEIVNEQGRTRTGVARAIEAAVVEKLKGQGYLKTKIDKLVDGLFEEKK